MKITCHACDAKYTIADEKVSGRTVKIKCKKCGATIVVNADPAAAAAPMAAPAGYPEPAPPAGDDDSLMATRVAGQDGAPPAITAAEWTVSLGEEERQMSQLQIAEEMQRGAITGDTYVWKDGMPDWLSVAQVPELAALLARYVPSAAAPAPYAPPAAPVQDEPHMGLAGTVVMSEAPAISPLAAAAPRPAAGMPAEVPPPAAGLAPVNQPTAAARRANRPVGAAVDVFAAAAEKQVERPKPPTPAGRLGERNENSVLFSLSALTATESAAAKGAAPEVADLGLGSSNGKSAVDDLMSLGGGAIGGPMLAPPPLLAPVVEPPPAPVPVAASVPPAAGPSMAPGPGAFEPMAPPKKSKTGLIIGIVAGVLVLGGVGAFVATSGGDEASGEAGATTASTSAAPATTSAAPTTTSATTSSAPTADATASDAPAASGTPVAANDPKEPSSSGGSGGPVSTKGGTGTTPSGKPTSEPVASAPTTTSSSAPAPDPGAGAGRDFNKGAATAALAAAAGAAKGCKQPGGPTGSASVRVVFAPSGNVTSANVQGPPFAGTPVGGCIASAFRGAHVPPFDGSPVAVSKTVHIN